MYEIRFHGRGGQGAVMAAQALADAAVRMGYHAQAFPYFGAERRGAPVQAYARIDTKKIRIKSQIYHPDLLVIMDESLSEIDDLAAGLKPDGRIVMNTTQRPEEVDLGAGVDARVRDGGRHRHIAGGAEDAHRQHRHAGRGGQGPGPRARSTSIVEAIEDRFGGKLGARAGLLNGEAAKRAYEATVVGRTKGHRVYVKQKAWTAGLGRDPHRHGAEERRTTRAWTSVRPRHGRT